jgi:hypothetical protein
MNATWHVAFVTPRLTTVALISEKQASAVEPMVVVVTFMAVFRVVSNLNGVVLCATSVVGRNKAKTTTFTAFM